MMPLRIDHDATLVAHDPVSILAERLEELCRISRLDRQDIDEGDHLADDCNRGVPRPLQRGVNGW